MAKEDNLTPFTGADDPHRQNGRPKGVPNRSTILNYLLFEADIDEMGIITNPPSWYEKVKPKNLYQVMTLAMASKAMSGDSKAFAVLNKAMGDKIQIEGDMNIALVEFVNSGKKNADNSKNSSKDS